MTDNTNDPFKHIKDLASKNMLHTIKEGDLAKIYCLPESVGLICAKARDYDEKNNNNVFKIEDNKCYARNDVVCFKCKSVLSMSHTFYRAYQSNPHPEKVFCIGCSVGEVKEILKDAKATPFEVVNRDNIKKSDVMFTNILFDEEMYDTLNAVFNGVTLRAELGDKESQKLFMQFGAGMIKIMDAFIDPVHEAGWCKDPTCEWKPKPKKK